MDSDTPLKRIEDLTYDQIQRLAAHWITSVEQLVGIASTPDGIAALSQTLAVNEVDTRALVERARDLLSPEDRAHLSSPADTSRYGLGATPPPKES